MVDDLDGGSADSTVTFGLDGATYEIDLSDDHAAALREHLSSYVAAARRAGGATPAARTRRTSRSDADTPRSRPDAQAMRSWARSNGYDLSDRGRIPSAVAQAYRDAGNGTAPAPAAAPVAETAATSSEGTDADVLAWHESKGYKIPADRTVNGLMRHRYRTAHGTLEG